MSGQVVIDILNGMGLVFLSVGGLVAYLGFKERIRQLSGILADLQQAHARSADAMNWRVEQFQQLLEEQRKIRDGFVKDMAGHQEIFRKWLDDDLDAVKKRSDRLRDELNRREATCDRLTGEKNALGEKAHRLEVELEKEKLIRSSIEQLIQVRVEEVAPKAQAEGSTAGADHFPRAA